MRKANLAITALLLMVSVGLAAAMGGEDLDRLVQRARKRREEVRTFFLKIYNGSPELCASIPEPTPTDNLAEDCLQGYNIG